MAEKTNSDLNLFDKAWDAAKTYNASDAVKRYDAVVETDTTQTLSNFMRTHGAETRGIDYDTKDDDKLLKYTVKRITPTKNLDEIANPGEVYLITDEQGHDIGTYMMTENGPEFKLNPKIKEGNDKIIAEFPGSSKEVLEEMYRMNTLEDVVDKLAKGETLALASKEQAQDDIAKEYEAAGMPLEDEKQYEDPDEKEAIDSLPSDMREEVVSQCRDRGIQIKEVLVVDCPKCIDEELVNGENHINTSGGPIIMVQAKSGDASQLSDDLYMFQDGQEIPNVAEDKDRMLNLMEQHKGEGAVPELEDTREDSMRARIENQIVLAEEMKKQHPEDTEQINSDLDLAVKSIIDYYGGSPSEEIQQQQENLREQHKEENEQAQETNDDDVRDRWTSADALNNH